MSKNESTTGADRCPRCGHPPLPLSHELPGPQQPPPELGDEAEEMTPQKGSVEQTAAHEAGHAAVAFRLGRAFRSVTVIPDGETPSAACRGCPSATGSSPTSRSALVDGS